MNSVSEGEVLLDVLAKRVGRKQRDDLGCCGNGKARLGRPSFVFQCGDGCLQWIANLAARQAFECGAVEEFTLAEFELNIYLRGDLDLSTVDPGGDGIAPGDDLENRIARLVWCNPRSEHVTRRPSHQDLRGGTGILGEHDMGTHLVMTLAEDRGRHRYQFTHDGFDGSAT